MIFFSNRKETIREKGKREIQKDIIYEYNKTLNYTNINLVLHIIEK